MYLNKRMKALCVQSCINSYEDEHKNGVHGRTDWTSFRDGSVEQYAIENCQGYTGVIDDVEHGAIFIIVFRGSDEDADWKNNFDFKKIRRFIEKGKEHTIPYGNKDSNIRMHKGFVELYAKVRSMLRLKAFDAAERGMKIIITGHSLGGALATVGFIDLHYMFCDELEIPVELTGYAAASPAVGNWEFRVSFNIRAEGSFFNEWYGEDTVHKLPPLWLGYFHVAEETRYADLLTNLTTPIFAIIPIAVWDHDPRKLLAAIKGEPIPLADLDTRN